MHTEDMLKERKQGRIWGVLGLLCAAFLFWMARGEYLSQKAFEQEGIVTTAEITERKEDGNSHYLSYRFMVGEKEYTIKKDYVDEDIYFAVDETIAIRYLTSDPNETRLVEDEFEPGKFFWIGMVLLSAGGGMGLAAPIGKRWQPTPLAKLIIYGRAFFTILGLMSLVAGVIVFTDRATGAVSNLCFSVCLFVIVVAIYQFYTDLENTHQSRKDAIARRDTDVTSENRPTPDGKYKFGEELAALGFKRLGETDRNIPNEELTTTWTFHNLDYTIIANTNYVLEVMSFDTWFGEKHLVQTMFPYGERIRQPDFWTDYSQKDVETTYRLHLANIEKFERQSSLHRRPVTSIADQMHLDLYYMSHFFAPITQRTATVMKLRVLFGVYLLIFGLGLTYGYSHFEDDVLWAYLIGGSALAFVFQILPGWLMNYRRIPLQFALVEKEIEKQEKLKAEKAAENREHWPKSIDEAYSEEERDANREGRLTERQIEYLEMESGIYGDWSVFHMIMSVILGAVLAMLILLFIIGDDSSIKESILFPSIVFCLALVANLYFFRKGRRKFKVFNDMLTTETVLVLKNVTKQDFIRQENPDDPEDVFYSYVRNPLVQIVGQYDLMEDDATYNIYYWSHVFDEDEWENYQWVLSIEKSSD